jgi:hypothetical protein
MSLNKLIPVAAALALSGCYKINYTTGQSLSSAEPAEKVWQHRFLYGIVEIGPVQADKICPGGIAQVSTKVSGLNGLVNYAAGIVPAGNIIYYPCTVEVWCTSGTAYNLEVSPDGAVVALTEIE